jgi:tRNA(fMet)-specific endonuclease VapC
MKYLLDSNIIIAAALAHGDDVRKRLAAGDEGDFVTSAVVYAEVAHGSVRGKPPAFERLEVLIEEIPVLPFDYRAAQAYTALPFRRASYDRLIAAHALSLGLTLVTDNMADFAEMPGLKVENWTVA